MSLQQQQEEIAFSDFEDQNKSQDNEELSDFEQLTPVPQKKADKSGISEANSSILQKADQPISKYTLPQAEVYPVSPSLNKDPKLIALERIRVEYFLKKPVQGRQKKSYNDKKPASALSKERNMKLPPKSRQNMSQQNSSSVSEISKNFAAKNEAAKYQDKSEKSKNNQSSSTKKTEAKTEKQSLLDLKRAAAAAAQKAIVSPTQNKEVWDRLWGDDSRKILEKLHLDKQRDDEKKEFQHCTFKPKLCPKSEVIVKQNNVAHIPVEQKLIEQRKIVEEKLQAERMAAQYASVADYPFRPQLVAHPSPYPHTPIEQRYLQVIKKKQEKLEASVQQEASFQPQINSHSNQIVARLQFENMDQDNLPDRGKGGGDTVFERLSKRALEQQQRRQDLIREHLELEDALHHKFFPDTSQSAQKSNILLFRRFQQQLDDDDGAAPGPTGKHVCQGASCTDDECTFTPQLNVLSRKMVRNTQNTSSVNTFDRLAVEDPQKRENHLLFLKTLQEPTQESFQPKILKKSREIIASSAGKRTRSLRDLAFNESTKKKIQSLIQEKIDKEDNELLFHPSTLSSHIFGSTLSSRYSQQETQTTLYREMQHKDRVQRESKKQKMKEQMLGCSFSPKINNQPYHAKQQQTLKTVKGLDNHFERLNAAERYKQEKLRIQEKMFDLHLRYKFSNHYTPTKVQPFNLSHTNTTSQIQNNQQNGTRLSTFDV